MWFGKGGHYLFAGLEGVRFTVLTMGVFHHGIKQVNLVVTGNFLTLVIKDNAGCPDPILQI